MAAEQVRRWWLHTVHPRSMPYVVRQQREPWPVLEVGTTEPVLSVSDLQREIDGVRNRHGMDPAALSALGELAERLDLDEKGS